MSFWGCSSPRVYLKYRANPAAGVVIDLPYPSSIVPAHEPVYTEVITRSGKLFRKMNGYRYKVKLVFVNISAANAANITKICNWTDDILLIPFSDSLLIGFDVYVDGFSPSFPKDRVVAVDTFEIAFVSRVPLPIRDYDNMIQSQEGYTHAGHAVAGGADMDLSFDEIIYT